jgi:hypothetical protein
MILVRLAKVHPDDLRDLVYGAWRMIAPKKLLAQAPKQVLDEQG